MLTEMEIFALIFYETNGLPFMMLAALCHLFDLYLQVAFKSFTTSSGNGFDPFRFLLQNPTQNFHISILQLRFSGISKMVRSDSNISFGQFVFV